MPTLSVIVANYNGSGLIGECLDSLRAQGFRDFETIVVDNASADGSAEFIGETYPEVRLIVNDRNLGFGAANNRGIETAKGKYIALLNNDAVAHKDWLNELIKAAAASAPDVGMWASKILLSERPDIIDAAGHVMFRDGLNIGRGKGEKDSGLYDVPGEVFFPSGCAALYLKDMLDEVGLFDPDFFAYGDDTELGLRARLSGWRCLYVPSSVVYHKGSATAGRYSSFKAYHVERNRIWVLIKCFPLRDILLSPLYTAVRLYYHFVNALRGRGAAGRYQGSRPGLFGIYIKAVFDGLSGAGRCIGKRRGIKTTVSTAEFAGWLRRFGISAREIAEKE